MVNGIVPYANGPDRPYGLLAVTSVGYTVLLGHPTAVQTAPALRQAICAEADGIGSSSVVSVPASAAACQRHTVEHVQTKHGHPPFLPKDHADLVGSLVKYSEETGHLIRTETAG